MLTPEANLYTKPPQTHAHTQTQPLLSYQNPHRKPNLQYQCQDLALKENKSYEKSIGFLPLPDKQFILDARTKGVNTVSEAVLVWPVVQYISDIYRSILMYHFRFTAILYIYIYIYVCVCIIINIKIYHKTLSQFRTNYSWFQILVSIKRKKKKKQKA